MAGYQIHIRVKKAFTPEARDFLGFLRNVGRTYPVKFAYRNESQGKFSLTFERTPTVRLDALLQELILNRGLYYYFSALRSSKKNDVLRHAILPIFQSLVESSFLVPCSRFLRRHILGKLPQGAYVPGELVEQAPHEYEVLFRKWDIGIMDDWNFVKDADSLLTNFLLKQVAHEPGRKSPRFPELLARACAKGIGIEREGRRRIERIHSARAGGLHRLQQCLTHEQLQEVATGLYLYFQYFDEFHRSQLVNTVRVHRGRFRRIRYGHETWPGMKSLSLPWDEITKRACHDCFALKGQYHCEGCDMEICPKCRRQLLGHGVVDIW